MPFGQSADQLTLNRKPRTMIHTGIIQMIVLVLSMTLPIICLCRKPKQDNTTTITPYTGPTYNRHGRVIGK